MSYDLGPQASGFISNFAYGTLALANNTYLKLVDLSDNAPGTEPESLYTNSLIVPAGCTLDLNGLKLYTRASQIAGIVVGGAVEQIPDGGEILFNTPNSGAVSVAGEMDEWNFFGRAGQMVTVAVNPGTSQRLRRWRRRWITCASNWSTIRTKSSVPLRVRTGPWR